MQGDSPPGLKTLYQKNAGRQADIRTDGDAAVKAVCLVEAGSSDPGVKAVCLVEAGSSDPGVKAVCLVEAGSSDPALTAPPARDVRGRRPWG
jgi:hypothetical protein